MDQRIEAFLADVLALAGEGMIAGQSSTLEVARW